MGAAFVTAGLVAGGRTALVVDAAVVVSAADAPIADLASDSADPVMLEDVSSVITDAAVLTVCSVSEKRK